ncbi:MAG TPA: hypothetical protein VGL38_14855 [bacterium]|jgi:hypothetical protein
MKLEPKPALVVIGTLLIGMALGALLLSVVMRFRMERLHHMMGHGGFQQSLIEAIGPMNDTQRTAVEEEIRQSSVRIDSTMNASRGQIDAMIDSMNVRLDSLLTPEQRTRLHQEIGRRPHGRGGPPFGGPRFGGLPPPDGRHNGSPHEHDER